MTNQVVVTGLGTVSPVGNNIESFWDSLLFQENKPQDYPYQKPHYMSNRRAYLVSEWETKAIAAAAWPFGKASQFALQATRAALADAGLLDSRPADSVIGSCLGMGTGDCDLMEGERENGTSGHPLVAFPFGAAAAVATRFELTGPNMTVSTACSAGCYSLSLARDAIEDGRADVMVVGGTEVISRVGQACFNRIDGLDPEVCRPFDVNRAGTVYGEGAAVLVLESAAHARKRGHEAWYAAVKGIGWSCDGYHPTAPEPSAEQSELAMRRALAEASLSPQAIHCVVCHGTGTELNDVTESVCLRNVFGPMLDHMPICAPKSKLGHSGGASGAFACLTAALILARGLVPATAHLATIDPRCRLNLHVGPPLPAQVHNVLINAYAFGGNNISVILGV